MVVCPSCNHLNAVGHLYCESCGQSLYPALAPSPSPEPTRAQPAEASQTQSQPQSPAQEDTTPEPPQSASEPESPAPAVSEAPALAEETPPVTEAAPVAAETEGVPETSPAPAPPEPARPELPAPMLLDAPGEMPPEAPSPPASAAPPPPSAPESTDFPPAETIMPGNVPRPEPPPPPPAAAPEAGAWVVPSNVAPAAAVATVPTAPAPRRRVWPWLVGGVFVFLLVAGGVVATVFLLFLAPSLNTSTTASSVLPGDADQLRTSASQREAKALGALDSFNAINDRLQNLGNQRMSVDDALKLRADIQRVRDDLRAGREEIANARVEWLSARNLKVPTWYQDYLSLRLTASDQNHLSMDLADHSLERYEGLLYFILDVGNVDSQVDDLRTNVQNVLDNVYDRSTDRERKVAEARTIVDATKQSTGLMRVRLDLASTQTQLPYVRALRDSFRELDQALEALDLMTTAAQRNDTNTLQQIGQEFNRRWTRVISSLSDAQKEEQALPTYVSQNWPQLLNQARDQASRAKQQVDQAERLYQQNSGK